VVLVALGTAVLGGCGSKDAASFVASAKGYVAKGNYSAAIIEVKNALQKDSNNGEARTLLAASLLETGDPAGAEAEVRKAMALHVSEEQTSPILARALGAQGQIGKLRSELGDLKLNDPAARAEVNTGSP
jgi:Flp pilus assembly protein TadD, contains TPR repeats